MASAGRPSKFDPKFIDLAKSFCALGATDQELADALKIDVRTLYRWKAENNAFCQALKTGKQKADERVERALFARATGYEHDEVDIRVAGTKIVKTKVRKHYPPDTTAAIFWLKNRRPEQWRETKAMEVSGAGGAPLTVQILKLTDHGSGDPAPR